MTSRFVHCRPFRCITTASLACLLCLVTSMPLRAESNGIQSTRSPDPTWLVPLWGAAGIVDDEQVYFGGFELRSHAVRYRLHPAMIVMRSGRGSFLAGLGVVYNHDFSDSLRLTAGFFPSYYDKNEGPDLGRKLEFLSSIELSWKFECGHRINVRFGHISNGSLSPINPGTELLTIGYAIPLP